MIMIVAVCLFYFIFIDLLVCSGRLGDNTGMCILFKITSSHLEVCVVNYRSLYFNITLKGCATSFTVSSEIPQNWVTYDTKLWKRFHWKESENPGVSSEIRTADEFILPLGGRRYFTVLAITYFLFSLLSACDVCSGRQLRQQFFAANSSGLKSVRLCVSLVNNRTCGRKTLAVCWLYRESYLAFGVAMRWGPANASDQTRNTLFSTVRQVAAQNNTMATVTGESLKTELEMFGVVCQDDSALDKSE